MSKVANWDTAPITGRASGAANLFNRTIPNELIRLMLTAGILVAFTVGIILCRRSERQKQNRLREHRKTDQHSERRYA